jgi:hypothetical protein
VKDYHKMGFTSVTHQNLQYRLSLLKTKGTINMPTEICPPTSNIFVGKQTTNTIPTAISDLTPDLLEVEEVNNQTVSRGGTVGTTNKTKDKYSLKVQKAWTEAAAEFK